jgi:hypothetical protein
MNRAFRWFRPLAAVLTVYEQLESSTVATQHTRGDWSLYTKRIANSPVSGPESSQTTENFDHPFVAVAGKFSHYNRVVFAVQSTPMTQT